MTIPDLSDHDLGAPGGGAARAEWDAVAVSSGAWETPEGIEVPPLYDAVSTEGLDFLSTYPGIAPYLRGPYPTMYVNQPWTVRQYAGSPPPRSRTRSIAAIWPRARRASP